MSAAKASSPSKPNKQLPKPKRKDAGPEPPVHFLPPLRPRRGIFVGLLVGFVVWIAFLLVLYFRTVHGHASP